MRPAPVRRAWSGRPLAARARPVRSGARSSPPAGRGWPRGCGCRRQRRCVSTRGAFTRSGGYGNCMASGEHPFDEISETLKKVGAALRDNEIPYLLGGSLAFWAHGGPERRRDLDFMVKPDDADRALAVLEAEGLRTERPPEGWLYK